MDFRDIVEANRPALISDEEQQRIVNERICKYVLSVAKGIIIKKARKHPQNGEPLIVSAKVYLGTTDDGFFDSIVESNTLEVKSFLPINKSFRTSYTVSANGLALLQQLQSAAKNDGIEIHDYYISFGHTSRSDYHDYYERKQNVRLTCLYGVHTHLFPVEVKHTLHGGSAYFLSPDTNGVFQKYTNEMLNYPFCDGRAGVYVRFSFKG